MYAISFWTQDKFPSLRAVHVPGVLKLAADFLSRQKLRSGEWMLNHQAVAQAGPALSASGQDLAPSTWDLEAVGVAHPMLQVLISSLPAEVQETIANARAPATRKLYSSKWKVFESWCLAHAVDPANCPIGPVLELLQERLEAWAAATTLRVYVAAIAAHMALFHCVVRLSTARLVTAQLGSGRFAIPLQFISSSRDWWQCHRL